MSKDEMVITFDGKIWSKSELLEKMSDNEFYYGYLGKNVLSSSSIKELLKSPRAYKNSIEHKQKDNDACMFGRLIHEQILEEGVDYEWNVIAANDKRSKAWKDAVKEGKPNTILERDYNSCMSVVQAYKSNKNTRDLLDDYDTEVSDIVTIKGIPFRVKYDAIRKDRLVIRDLKTTGDINKFNKWTCMSYGYDCQVYIYCEAAGIPYSDFEFVVIDKITKVSGIYSVSQDFYESGKRKVHEAIETYKRYFRDREQEVNDYIIKGEL